MMDDQESRSDEETSETLYDKMDKAIQAYFKKNFEELEESKRGDYIAAWVLVVNYGNLEENDGFAGDYLVEAMPQKTPPHATKGLLRQGIDEIMDIQYGDYDDESA